jgi:hypothetical protein
MSLLSDTSSWFRVNQSFLFLNNAVCLEEKQQILIARGEYANHYTTEAVNYEIRKKNI